MSNDYNSIINKRINKKEPKKETERGDVQRLRKQLRNLQKVNKRLISELSTSERALRKSLELISELTSDKKIEDILKEIKNGEKEEADLEDFFDGEVEEC